MKHVEIQSGNRVVDFLSRDNLLEKLRELDKKREETQFADLTIKDQYYSLGVQDAIKLVENIPSEFETILDARGFII